MVGIDPDAGFNSSLVRLKAHQPALPWICNCPVSIPAWFD